MAIDLRNIEDTPHLLSILLAIEDVLDSMDIYVFKNWIDGELVEGPIIKRYWVGVTLKYEYKNMPDPRAGYRLLKHDILVNFTKAKQEAKGDEELEDVWLVSLDVPRRLINGINDASTDFYDDEVDIEDVESAKDLGVDEETPYSTGKE